MTAGNKLFDSIDYTSFFFPKDKGHGLKIAHVLDIIHIKKFTEIPGMPEPFIGVIKLRNKVIPVMDTRTESNSPATGSENQPCIIVAKINAIDIGLLVDDSLVLGRIFRKAMWDCQPARRQGGRTNISNAPSKQDRPRIRQACTATV